MADERDYYDNNGLTYNPGKDREIALREFKKATGRDMRPDELSWLDSGRGHRGYTDAALNVLAAQDARYTDEILTRASASGLKNFSRQDAQKIVGDYYRIGMGGGGAGDEAKLFDLAASKLTGLLGEQTEREQKDAVDRATNPEKYITTDQKSTNLANADRLIADAFGADFKDPDFADFLATQTARGIDNYQLAQMIQQDPRYIKNKQDAENLRIKTEASGARDALSQSLVAQEDASFDRTKQSVIGSFMGAGRLNSSGLDAALARARENLQRDRQAFLGNIAYEDSVRQQGYGREDFMSRQGGSYQNFLRQNEPSYQQQFNLQNAGNYAKFQSPWDRLNRSYGLSDALVNRGYEDRDYTRSRNDYFDALGQQRRASREAAMWGLAGNALGSAGQIGLMKWAGAFK